MFCPNCNKVIDNDSNFCKYCGMPKEFIDDYKDNGVEIGWNFRNIKDVRNIIPYSTLHLVENHLFFSYLYKNFSDCIIDSSVPVKQLFPNAPEYAMPINFMLTKNGKKVVILIVEGQAKYKRYSVLETMELCRENNITALRFITTYPNEESYVANRIRKFLE